MQHRTVHVLCNDRDFDVSPETASIVLIRRHDIQEITTALSIDETALAVCDIALIDNSISWLHSTSSKIRRRICFFGTVNADTDDMFRAAASMQGALSELHSWLEIFDNTEGADIDDVAVDAINPSSQSLRDAVYLRIMSAVYSDGAEKTFWEPVRYNSHLRSIATAMQDVTPSPGVDPGATSFAIASCVLAARLTKYLISKQSGAVGDGHTPHGMPTPISDEPILLRWEKAFPIIFGLVDFLDDSVSISLAANSNKILIKANGIPDFTKAPTSSQDINQVQEYCVTVKYWLSQHHGDSTWSYTTDSSSVALEFTKALPCENDVNE